MTQIRDTVLEENRKRAAVRAMSRQPPPDVLPLPLVQTQCCDQVLPGWITRQRFAECGPSPCTISDVHIRAIGTVWRRRASLLSPAQKY